MNITRSTTIRVGYKETDAMGIVHHSNYATFCEMARTEIFRQMGMTYKQMEQDGIMLPVREVNMCFYSPAYYDDELTITLKLKEEPRVKLIFEHEIRNQNGVLINSGNVVLVFVDAVTRKPRKAPAEFMALLG